MTKGIFVTATGTDVGKTYVCGLLVKKIREYRINCGYYKPVLSGLEKIDGKLIPGDCKQVIETAKLDIEPTACVTYAFEQAVSPHLASRLSNTSISIEKIKDDFYKKSAAYDYVVVEGAGGITCPIVLEENKTVLLPNIIKALNLDVIVVAPADLGSINYALLTCEYAKKIGIRVKGIILNGYDESDFMHRDNKACIEKLCKVKVIATVKENDTNLDIPRQELINIFGEV